MTANGAPSGNHVWSGQSVRALQSDSTQNVVYVVDHDAGQILRVDIGSGTATVLASAQNHPSSIAVGSTWIVWTNDGDGNATGSVMRVGIP